MEIKVGDYIVITVSSEKDAETEFLKKAGRSDGEVWCYAAMGPDCTQTTISKPTKENTSNETKCYSFYLINAECWKCGKQQHKDNCSCNKSQPSGKIKSLLESIKKCNKKIIVWTHTTDNITCQEIKLLFNNNRTFCDSFSHLSTNHEVEKFMFQVCKNGNGQDNFQEKFIQLIKASLKPHLIAHTLRADILTPFIPFHLFHQLDNKESLSNDSDWQNIFKECCSVINNTDTEKDIEKKFNKLIELKKDIPLDFKDCSTGRFKELKEIFQKSENDCVKNIEKKNCLKIIEEFAQCLEKIVNYIESGEEASARN